MVNKRGLFFLTVMTTIAVVLAAVATTGRRGASSGAQGGGEPLFPALVAAPNDVARLTITRAGETFTLARDGETWRLEEIGGYPAKFEKVRETLLGLADYRLVEAKTARPDSYARLKVEDVDAPGAQSTLVRVEDARGRTLGAALFGDRRGAMARGGSASVFVRREGEAQSWRAQGNLYLDVAKLNWIEREIVRLERRRTSDVIIAHADGDRLHVSKESPAQPMFDLPPIPDGFTPASPAVGDSVGQVFAHVAFDDARRAELLPLDDHRVATVTGKTFDGLVITLRLSEVEGATWATATFAVDDALLAARGEGSEPAPDAADRPKTDEGLLSPAEVRAEAAMLGERAAGWAFKMPSFKAETLRRRLSDLLTETRTGEDPAAAGGEMPPDDGWDETNYAAMIEALRDAGVQMPAADAPEATGDAPDDEGDAPDGAGDEGGSGGGDDDGGEAPEEAAAPVAAGTTPSGE